MTEGITSADSLVQDGLCISCRMCVTGAKPRTSEMGWISEDRIPEPPLKRAED